MDKKFCFWLSVIVFWVALEASRAAPMGFPAVVRSLNTGLQKHGIKTRPVTEARLHGWIAALSKTVPPESQKTLRQILETHLMVGDANIELLMAQDFARLELVLKGKTYPLTEFPRIFDEMLPSEVCRSSTCDESDTYPVDPERPNRFPAQIRKVPPQSKLAAMNTDYELQVLATPENHEALARYFGLTSFPKPTQATQVPLVELLPPLPRRLAYLYPRPLSETDRVLQSPNCFATTRSFFKEKFPEFFSINSPIAFREFIRRNYCLLGLVEGDLAYGDIIEDSQYLHSVRFLLTDNEGTHWVFSKENARHTPWLIQPLREAFATQLAKGSRLYQYRRCEKEEKKGSLWKALIGTKEWLSEKFQMAGTTQ